VVGGILVDGTRAASASRATCSKLKAFFLYKQLKEENRFDGRCLVYCRFTAALMACTTMARRSSVSSSGVVLLGVAMH
jgi:hypothetical protein